ENVIPAAENLHTSGLMQCGEPGFSANPVPLQPSPRYAPCLSACLGGLHESVGLQDWNAASVARPPWQRAAVGDTASASPNSHFSGWGWRAPRGVAPPPGASPYPAGPAHPFLVSPPRGGCDFPPAPWGSGLRDGRGAPSFF